MPRGVTGTMAGPATEARGSGRAPEVRVFSATDGRDLGRLRVLSAREMVLETERPWPAGEHRRLAMILPQRLEGANTLTLPVRCTGSWRDGARCFTSFDLVDSGPAERRIVDALAHLIIRLRGEAAGARGRTAGAGVASS